MKTCKTKYSHKIFGKPREIINVETVIEIDTIRKKIVTKILEDNSFAINVSL